MNWLIYLRKNFTKKLTRFHIIKIGWINFWHKLLEKYYKSKTEKTARKRFQKLYDKINELPKEIKEFIKNLSKYLNRAIQHTINNKILSTNNLIEGFYKTTLPRKIKRIFKTYGGLLIRITLNNIRWIKRYVIINKN